MKLRRAMFAAVTVLVLAAGVLLISRSNKVDLPPGVNGESRLSDGVVVIEAEAAETINEPARRVSDPNASGDSVNFSAADKVALESAAPLQYTVDVAEKGRYRLWIRAWWQDGCSNSVAIALNEMPPALVGNDGSYRVWHWVRGPAVRLESGAQTLRLYPRENNVRIDQIILSKNRDFWPVGIVGPGKKIKDSVIDRPMDSLPVLSAADHHVSGNFAIGVGGVHLEGWEAILLKLGLPFERIVDHELSRPEALARYRIICLSKPITEGKLGDALNGWVKAGGTLLAETLHGAKMGSEGRELFAPAFPDSRVSWRGKSDVVLRGGSPYFKGIKEGTPVYPEVFLNGIPREAAEGGIEFHGEMYTKMQRVQRTRYRFVELERLPVMMKKAFGKGVLFYFALPPANGLIFGDDRFDALAENVLLSVTANEYPALFRELSWNPPAPDRISFSDDFMRSTDEEMGWSTESGEWQLNGDKPSGQLPPFTLVGKTKGTAIARVTGGSVEWEDFCMSVTLNSLHGSGGIGLNTKKGARALVIDRGARAVQLLSLARGKSTVLAEVPLPGPASAWRRLSLMIRDGAWQGFIDGQLLLHKKTGETVYGEAALLVTEGEVMFDDVRACSTAALAPGRDRLVGDEGSYRTQTPGLYGLEPRTVYAPMWLLRPDGARANTLKAELPTYHDAILKIDGLPVGIVKADPDGPRVFLPKDAKPRFQVELATKDWLDYNFSKQLIDWYPGAGTWKRASRWSCDPRWSFLSVSTPKSIGVLWHRRTLKPPYAINLVAAFTMPSKDMEVGRDINLILGGDGTALTKGVTIRVGQRGDGIFLKRDGKLLAHLPDVGIPRDWLNIHNRWFLLKAVVTTERLRFYFEGRQVADLELARPLTGQVGIWTEKNHVSVARVTLAVSE